MAAPFQNPALILGLFLTTTFIITCAAVAAAAAPVAAAAAAAAPSPTSAPINLTGILDKGSQYATFSRLLKVTEAYQQVLNQLDEPSDGLTLLAPTDNAFKTLKPGTLNKLTAQEQSELVLYHVLAEYYTFDTFETASNPVRTQASGYDGVDTLNVTSTSSNQVNVSTGVVETTITNAIYSEYPLAVYSLEKVLLPYELFGPNVTKRPSNSPPAPAAKPKDGKGSSSTAGAPSSENDQSNSAPASRFVGRRWGFVVGLVFTGAVVLI